MAKSDVLPFTQKSRTKGAIILNADGTTQKTVYTASTEDAVVKMLQIVSNDTSARVVDILVNISGTDYPLGSVTVPASSGTNGVAAAVDVLSGALITALPYDGSGKRVLPLEASVVLKVASQTTLTAGKQITVVASVEEY